MHAETAARLDRLASERNNEPAHDWAKEVRGLAHLPPGMARLKQVFSALSSNPDHERLLALNDDDATFVEWLTEALQEAADDGAVLVEVRFGAKWGIRSGFMSLFRDAESRVRERYPIFCAEALTTGLWPSRPGALEAFEDSLRAAEEGLAGIDFIPVPYDEEADWSDAYVWASRAADAGLGITAHVGEVSPANIEAGLRLPGVSRLGHAVHGATSAQILDQMLDARVAVECCLTANVVLGAVPSLDEHPIVELVQAGVPITIASDDPVRACTSIGREYGLAASLGFQTPDLLSISRTAVTASFTSPERKAGLLHVLDSDVPSGGQKLPHGSAYQAYDEIAD